MENVRSWKKHQEAMELAEKVRRCKNYNLLMRVHLVEKEMRGKKRYDLLQVIAEQDELIGIYDMALREALAMAGIKGQQVAAIVKDIFD